MSISKKSMLVREERVLRRMEQIDVEKKIADFSDEEKRLSRRVLREAFRRQVEKICELDSSR